MNIIVFGSTGGTGLAAIKALIDAGHQVSGFARDPAKLPALNGLTAIKGDVMDSAKTAAAIAGHDVVIITLGNSQNPFAMMLGAKRNTPKNVCEVGTRNIIAGMQAADIQRLLVVTAFGIGDTRDNLPFTFKLFYRLVLSEHMADKEKQEVLVKTSGSTWTLVQPVGLTDGPATGNWHADTSGVIYRQQISRADVAAFLAILAAEGGYKNSTVALSG